MVEEHTQTPSRRHGRLAKDTAKLISFLGISLYRKRAAHTVADG